VRVHTRERGMGACMLASTRTRPRRALTVTLFC